MLKTALPLLLTLVIFALGFSNHAQAEEVCAQTPQDVAASPALKQTMKTFGGASQLFQPWKLSGFAGMISKVVVELTASHDQMVVQVNDALPNDFFLCVDSKEPDTFLMRVQNPREPENALFMLKAREPGKSLMVAAAKTKWKFMKFKRHDLND